MINIIGIGGVKHSGKDTAASMFNYILSKGLTNADYKTWADREEVFNNSHKDRTVHFADTMKDCLHLIYGIPRDCFDSQVYKDFYWWNLREGGFISNESLRKNEKSFNPVGGHDLANSSIRECVNSFPKRTPVIRIRTLMQYFGTDVCRDRLGYNIWVDSAIRKAKETAEKFGYCIVPDVRFPNEATGIRNAALMPPVKSLPVMGHIVRIDRDTHEYDIHESEACAFGPDYTIDNNGTLMSLFYRVHEVCRRILS